MNLPREVELKLEIEPADRDRLATHFGMTAAKALASTYFDDADLGLRKAGLTLRVRGDGACHVQTIKDSSPAAGLHDRAEWEQPVDGTSPDLDGLAAVLKARRTSLDLAAVVPRFSIAVERHAVVIDRAGATIELALDAGTATADGRTSPINELELELKHGDPAALFALAREIDALAPVRLGVFTKAERGYRLLDRRGARPVKAARVDLETDMDTAAAFTAIAQACLRQFRMNEIILIAMRDPDALHQARVALRRLRSAFSLFRELLAADPAVAALRGGLRWLAGLLGEARNLDVLIERSAGSEHLQRLRQARDASYDDTLAALATPRARHLMLDVAAWLAAGDWLGQGARDLPVSDFAADALSKHRKRLKKRGARLAKLDDEERHQVRIEAKKLRYATEFFESLFTRDSQRRRFKAFRDDLEVVQSALGDLNDRATAPLVWAALGIAPPPAVDEPPRDKLLADAAQGLERMVDRKPFWR